MASKFKVSDTEVLVNANDQLHTIGAGAKTVADTANLLTNIATSSTASIIKSGVEIQSTGTWNGTSASNLGLHVSAVSGGTNNYDAIFNGGGNVGIGNTSPVEKLEVSGAIKIGTATNTNDGTIRWTGTDFEGRKGGAWVSLTKAGDVVGPGASTDNAIARYDSTTGKLIQNSGVTIDDSNNVTIPGNLEVTGTVEFTGGLGLKVVAVTSNYTPGDEAIILANGGSTLTITLPAASISTNRVYTIKRNGIGSSNVVIQGDVSSETIDGSISKTLNGVNFAVTVVCDGADWYIINSYGPMGTI